MAKRKSATNLTDDERDSLLAAVREHEGNYRQPRLTRRPSKFHCSTSSEPSTSDVSSVTVPSGSTVNMGHQGPCILAVAPGVSLKVREGTRGQRLHHRSSLLGLDRSQRNVGQVVRR